MGFSAKLSDDAAQGFAGRFDHRSLHTKMIGRLQHQNSRLAARALPGILAGMKSEHGIDAGVRRGDISDAAIAHRLLLLRTALGHSQGTMGEVIGTSLTNYQHMEKKGRIGPEYVHKLDDKYGADHNFIYKGDWDKLHGRTLEKIRATLATRTP